MWVVMNLSAAWALMIAYYFTATPIRRKHALKFSVLHKVSLIEPNRLVANLSQNFVRMRCQKKDLRSMDNVLQTVEGFFEKQSVTDADDLIQQ